MQWQGKLVQVQINQGHWDGIERELTELLHGELEVKGLPATPGVDVPYLVTSRAAMRVEPYDPTTKKRGGKDYSAKVSF